MNAPNWNGEPGACRYDRDREDLDTRPDPETCAHPLHWRRETSGVVADGECRLCGASASTITRQRMQDLLTVRDTFASVEDFAAECEKRR